MNNKNAYDYKTFKKQLMAASNNAKQRDIAEKIGITESDLSKLFNGSKYPSIELLLTINSVYGCSIDDLLGICSDKREKTYRDFAEDILNYKYAFGTGLFNFSLDKDEVSHEHKFDISILAYLNEELTHIQAMKSLFSFARSIALLENLVNESNLNEFEKKELYTTMAQKYLSKVPETPLPYPCDDGCYPWAAKDLDFNPWETSDNKFDEFFA